MRDDNIFLEGQVMWSMIDANNHLRHSAYADFAAQSRINLMRDTNMASVLEKAQIGPILFREELIYLKEVRMNDTVRVAIELLSCRTDGARYTMKSSLYRGDGALVATVTVDGAWLDLKLRKLCPLPEEVQAAFLAVPKSTDFVLQEVPKK